MIIVENVVKEFEIDSNKFRAVDNVSFSVNKGEIYGIIGLSGAGKSTLVRCINRLEEVNDGRVIIDGVNITALDEKSLLKERKKIGMIFQAFNLFHQKTVYENIAYPLKIIGMSKQKLHERVLELLDFIDLREKKNAYPSELSGGQKQRVSIARAIANRPSVLLSDEGTSALDPANTKQILNLLKKTVEQYNMTIIMITHQMEVAKDICDRIAVMENGRIIEEADVETLFRNPRTDRTRSFIDSLQFEEQELVIDAKLYKGKVVRLSYSSELSNEPILSNCIKRFNIDVNLISGNINSLRSGNIGYMYIEILGDKVEVLKAQTYLEENGLIVEVV